MFPGKPLVWRGVGCIYVVLGLMFKSALRKMKIRHVAAEKIGNGVFIETLKPYNFSSSNNCGPTKTALGRAGRALKSSTNSFKFPDANLDPFSIRPSHKWAQDD